MDTLPVDLLCVHWLRSRQSGLLVLIILTMASPGRHGGAWGAGVGAFWGGAIFGRGALGT